MLNISAYGIMVLNGKGIEMERGLGGRSTVDEIDAEGEGGGIGECFVPEFWRYGQGDDVGEWVNDIAADGHVDEMAGNCGGGGGGGEKGGFREVAV